MKKLNKIIVPFAALACIGLAPVYFVAPASASVCSVPYPDGNVGTGIPTLTKTGLITEDGLGYSFRYNGRLYFGANDGTHGTELWSSDGSTSGTGMVKDINPGEGDSYPGEGDWTVKGNIILNGKFFFNANDGTHGNELWVTDGTTVGTTLVKDINPGNGNGNPYELTAFNSKIYFYADDGTHGSELWSSDGTAEGTTMVKDIVSGDGSGYPNFLTLFNNKIYFSANDGSHGSELWSSDGSAEGTTMLKDINPGSEDAYPYLGLVYNNKLYFRAGDGSHDSELWSTDGTTEGTTMVKDINPGSGASNPAQFKTLGGKMYFVANDGSHGNELWVTDGTTVGTTMLKDISPGTGYGDPLWITVFDGKLYFAADDDIHDFELWASDGTTEGTAMVKDINLDGGSGAAYFAVANDTLFFWADDCTHEYELWTSDGTNAGTVLVSDLYPGFTNGANSALAVLGNGLLFFGDNGVSGQALWTFTGIEAIVPRLASLIADRPRTATPGVSAIDPNTPIVKISATDDSLVCTAEALLYQSESPTTPAIDAVQRLSLLADDVLVASAIAVNGVVEFARADVRGGIVHGVNYTCNEYATYKGASLFATSHQRSVEQAATLVLRAGRDKAWATYAANYVIQMSAHHEALDVISQARAAALIAGQNPAPLKVLWEAEMALWKQSLIDDHVLRDTGIEKALRDYAKVLADGGVGIVG